MITNVSLKAGCRTRWLSNVVFPLPRKPVSSDTGIGCRVERLSDAIASLVELVSLLSFNAERGGRSCQQAGDADGFACVRAPAIRAVLNTQEGILDFFEQLSLAVSHPELKRKFFLGTRPVIRIGPGNNSLHLFER